MQSLTYQQNTGFTSVSVINRNQPSEVNTSDLRNAVRAWAGREGQDVVAALIVQEWYAQGGGDIQFPADIDRQRQKLFRFIDNRNDTEQYRRNVELLTPAILAVLPLEHRGCLLPQDSFVARLADMERELSEAKQAVMLNAPRHQKLKEMSEGVISMLRLDPNLAAPLMAIITTAMGSL